MISGVQLKICGITNLDDAQAADLIGADFLGFILYPKSPCFIPLATFVGMSSQLGPGKRVAVMVTPSVEELAAVNDAGFDFFQLHFDPDTDRDLVETWGRAIKSDRLWLAPQLPPDQPFPDWLLRWTDTFLIDTYRKDAFGGSGKTGDWNRFHNLQAEHPEKQWVLAGGLQPGNIQQALAESRARTIDVNSGVELRPGIKDSEKLKALAVGISRLNRRYSRSRNPEG
jgi:phosphoribosylanthranilate isomerase